MMEIEKPKITCEETENGCFARFIVEPLDRGFGITIGNCLRRVLLSALPGAAAIGIKINGVQHEFSTIKGVVEDVVDIVLNIKNLAVKAFDTAKFNSSVSIEHSKATEILSQSVVIATADVKMGDAKATAWGCDLTHGYIEINADYRS